jgi:sugar lactone lactonase YvrE
MIDFAPLNSVRSRLGEGPVWTQAAGEQWWIDIHRGTFHRHVWETGAVHSHKLSDRSSFVIPCADASIISSLQKGLCPVPESGPLADPVILIETETPDTSINDGKTGPDGRLYFDTLDRLQRPEMCGLYRLNLDLTVTRLMDKVTLGNGIDWSPDGTRMYFADSGKQRVYWFAFDPLGDAIGQPRVFVEVAEEDGMPDGLTVDAAGDLWVALYGGGRLHRYAPDGVLREVVNVPVAYPTSCAFGGPDLKTLIVTSAFAHIEDAGEQPGKLDGAVLTATVDAVGKPAVLCKSSLQTRMTENRREKEEPQ